MIGHFIMEIINEVCFQRAGFLLRRLFIRSARVEESSSWRTGILLWLLVATAVLAPVSQ